MTAFKMESPKITSDLPELSIDLNSLQSEDQYDYGLVSDQLMEYQDVRKVSFEKIIFKNVTITETSLTELELTDVIFDKCDLSNVNFSNSAIHRTEFRSCKLIGTDFTGSTLRNVRFSSCFGDYATFRFFNARQVAFEECSLICADFYQTTLQKVSFTGSKIDQAQLSGTKLHGIDLSDCDFERLGVEIQDLSGCIISPYQASSFAGLLGLVIRS